MALEIYGNNHSYFALYYQLILVTKNQMKIFNDEIIEFIIENFKKNSKQYLIEYVDCSYEKDHIHIDFKAHPKSELVKFINSYKSATSRLIKKKFPHTKDILVDNGFWEKTYFLISKTVPTDEVVKHFIKMKLNCNK